MLQSKFINDANKYGVNYGVYYFLGVFISFFIGQMIGGGILLGVLALNGGLSLENIETIANPTSLGIDKNLSFFLLTLPFVISGVLLYYFVKYVHKRPFLTVITPFKKINWKKFFFAFFVWAGLLAVLETINYLSDSENYILQFSPVNFLKLFLISVPMLFFQTGYEEWLFRGYGMQWIGKYLPYRIFPLLITSIIFAAMHLGNPEVSEYGIQVMVDYLSIGVLLGIVTLLSDSLELAMGLHFANNLFLSLFVTFESSVLQTDAIFRIKELEFNTTSQLISIGLLTIFYFIVKYKYNLKPFKFLFQKDILSNEKSVN